MSDNKYIEANYGSNQELTEKLYRAVASYQAGKPVVVLTSPDGGLLHGRETLQAIADTKINLECATILIPREWVSDFNNSDWPELLEAARIVFMRDGWPKK